MPPHLDHRRHPRTDHEQRHDRGERHTGAMTRDEPADAIARAGGARHHRLRLEMATQIHGQRVRGFIAIGPIARHGLERDPVEVALELPVSAGSVSRFVASGHLAPRATTLELGGPAPFRG